MSCKYGSILSIFNVHDNKLIITPNCWFKLYLSAIKTSFSRLKRSLVCISWRRESCLKKFCRLMFTRFNSFLFYFVSQLISLRSSNIIYVFYEIYVKRTLMFTLFFVSIARVSARANARVIIFIILTHWSNEFCNSVRPDTKSFNVNGKKWVISTKK